MLALLGLHELLVLLVGLDALLVGDGVELLHQQLLEHKDRVGRSHKDLGLSLLELLGIDGLGVLADPIDELGYGLRESAHERVNTREI